MKLTEDLQTFPNPDLLEIHASMIDQVSTRSIKHSTTFNGMTWQLVMPHLAGSSLLLTERRVAFNTLMMHRYGEC